MPSLSACHLTGVSLTLDGVYPLMPQLLVGHLQGPSWHPRPSKITSLQIDGETVETVADFIFLGSKITADGDCSHEIKRHSLKGKL